MANESEFKIIEIDPYLKDYSDDIALRMKRYKTLKSKILKYNRSIKSFASGHLFFGFHKHERGYVYREWAPAAVALNLIGDFNFWNRESHPLERLGNGVWQVFINTPSLHLAKVKVQVTTQNGEKHDRIPLYIKRALQEEDGVDFKGQVWLPECEFVWEDHEFSINKKEARLIYECHIGMSGEQEGVSTFAQFQKNVLPWIKKSGYNTIQIMAVAEHPYYASFGYHVSNFFAVSSRFGTPDDLKALINKAHKLGIAVLMDVVHSHSVANTNEGINMFDGTQEQFFLPGDRANHPAWGSKLFDYSNIGVLHFLLSNLKYWLEEYHFDGFRFDGVTSMIYNDNALGTNFDSYDKYFSLNTNIDAINFLQLANELIKTCNPNSISIAEDMSGMPGMAIKIKDGGLGFDYRLAMGVPDFWKHTLDSDDEHWDLHKLWHELTTTRPQEKTIGYCESHDQALVGDKTIIFKLADKQMYSQMNKDSQSVTIDRAIALHKLIKAATMCLCGEGFLNFMGNEFGHPEWIDFPREGNNWSYKFARRQWNLATDANLRYKHIYNFDKELIDFSKKNSIFQPGSKKTTLSLIKIDEQNKLLVFEKNHLVFLFNFNPTQSFKKLFVPTKPNGAKAGKKPYKVIFSSDCKKFGGNASVDIKHTYKEEINAQLNQTGINIYSPCRTLIVLSK